MACLDKKLQQIQEPVDEGVGMIAAIAGGFTVVGLLLAIFNIINMKVKGKASEPYKNKQLSDQVNNVLGTKDEWFVFIISSKDINAFSFGCGRHIFITSKLKDMLTERELTAVLLHEAYHSKAKHTYKDLAFKYPLYYLVITASLLTLLVSPWLVLLIAAMLWKIPNLLFNVFISKKQEYNADKYASENGYGKDLISALNKIEKEVRKSNPKECTDTLCRLVSKIDSILSSHPETQARTEKILKDVAKIKSMSISKVKNIVMKFTKKE